MSDNKLTIVSTAYQLADTYSLEAVKGKSKVAMVLKNGNPALCAMQIAPYPYPTGSNIGNGMAFGNAACNTGCPKCNLLFQKEKGENDEETTSFILQISCCGTIDQFPVIPVPEKEMPTPSSIIQS